MITMEKIDYVISVTGAEYDEVREALLQADGDVDLAIGRIMGKKAGEKQRQEESSKYFNSEEFSEFSGKVSEMGDEIIAAIKEIYETGNATKLVIMDDDDNEILSVTLTIGAIGAIVAPYVALVGIGIGLIGKWEFYVYLKDGKVINIKDYIKGQNRLR